MLTRVIRSLRTELMIRRDPVSYARSIGVRIGEGSRIFSTELGMFGSEPYLVRIGARCFITEGVQFISHDGGVLLFRGRYPDADLFGRINVGNNVFIGFRAIVLLGV